MNPLADLLLGPARRRPEQPWVTQPVGRAATYRDLERESAALAHVLVDAGVRPGDRVAVQVDKSLEALVLHVACVRAGAVYVPLNPDYGSRELSGLLDDAEPCLLVREQERAGDAVISLAELVAAASSSPGRFDDVERAPSDPAAMLFTSGTTGRPKAAVLSHANLVANAGVLVSAWGFSSSDVLVHALPLFHTHGLFVAAHCAMASGATITLLPSFSTTAVLEALPAATVYMGVPTHYVRLLGDAGLTADVAAGMRLFTSGSAPMLVATHEEFTRRTGQVILERYGMTETCMLTSNPLVGQRRIGTVGPVLPGVEARIAGPAPGPVEVRGPNVFEGYWKRPQANAEAFTDDGWFRTGDLGEFDPDGYLRLVGRSKDLVISGGLNVYPKEVEQVLDALPGVLESAVVGLPDSDLGEMVVAVVVPQPGADLAAEVLRRSARQRLAGYKVPKRVVVVAELPRNAMGKVEKSVLRARLAPPGGVQ